MPSGFGKPINFHDNIATERKTVAEEAEAFLARLSLITEKPSVISNRTPKLCVQNGQATAQGIGHFGRIGLETEMKRKIPKAYDALTDTCSASLKPEI